MDNNLFGLAADISSLGANKTCRECNELKPLNEFGPIRGKQHARGICNPCRRVKWKLHFEANKDSVRSITRKAYKKYREANLELVRARIRKCVKNAYLRNPSIAAARSAKKYAKKKNAFAQWSNKFFIEEIYDLARLRTKATGFKWEVDHIVPLQSRIVCGLHCEANLRVIPASQNRTKGNRFWPEMP